MIGEAGSQSWPHMDGIGFEIDDVDWQNSEWLQPKLCTGRNRMKEW